MLDFAKYKESNFKYLLENYKFDLNKQTKSGNTVMHYLDNVNLFKLLFKYDGNIDLEIKNNNGYIPIEIISNIKVYKFLAKYTNLNNKLYSNNILFKFEIFKFNSNKIE